MKSRIIRKYTLLTALVVSSWYCWAWRYEVAEWIRDTLGIQLPNDPRPAGVSELEWCEMNYRDEISALAKEHDLPYEYLMSLIVLECGGDRPAGHRFENHIYQQLQQVKKGDKRRLENVHKENLSQLDDDALKNLATSWGPFQIMGYKVFALDASVHDLRDEHTATELGVTWIKGEYGRFLKKKKFKDAFHYHNTGRRFPLTGKSRTHDPYYVSDGIRYMDWFRKRELERSKSNPPETNKDGSTS